MECLSLIVKILSVILFIITFPLSLVWSIRILETYERAIVLRLGKLVKGCPKGPGAIFCLRPIDLVYVVDLRLIAFEVPTQEALTKDAVSVRVDAVVYYRISNPLYSILNIADYKSSTCFLAMTMLRNIIGQKSLIEVLEQREELSKDLQLMLDEASDPWGVVVERVELKEVRLPEAMHRAMAAEAEATQEAKAKIIDAEGELKASQTLYNAANLISNTTGALQLRYLQTLSTITVERQSTILFPIPMDVSTIKF